MSDIQELKDLNLNCNVFQVCDYEGHTIQEVLSIFFTKINELIKSQNNVMSIADFLVNEGLKKEVAARLEVLLQDGTLSNLLSDELLKDITARIEKVENDINTLNTCCGEVKESIKNTSDNLNVKMDSLNNKILESNSAIDDNKQNISYLNTELEKLREMIKNSTGSGDVTMPSITTRIAIDSGHGDSDPGTTFVPGSTEAIKCREIVDRCISILQSNGCTNILDVQKGTQPPAGGSTTNANLNARVTKVNNWGADVCVSVHMNSNAGTPGTGTETYVISMGGKAEQYARRINTNVVNAIGTVNRGIKTGNFAIIRDTVCPACLVEVLFANNTNDTAKYDPEKIAMAICEGILNKSLSGDGSTANYVEGKISKEGMKLIKSWEGFSQNPYTDALGYRTVGYGLTEKYRPDDFKSMQPFPTTEEKAAEYLVSGVESDYARTVFNYISAKGKIGVLNQNRFDALVSIAYNKGANGLVNSSLMAAILDHPTSDTVKTLMLNYEVREGTAAEQGLRNRRQDEYNLYSGIASTRKIGIFNGTTATGEYVTSNNGYGYIPPSIL